jgi:Spy/CpxP family protein refolding chaperone
LKNFFLIIAGICWLTALHAQSTKNFPERMQRWRDLNLTAQQKEKIQAIMCRRKIQNYIDWIELNSILTREQKERLKKWKGLKKDTIRRQPGS